MLILDWKSPIWGSRIRRWVHAG